MRLSPLASFLGPRPGPGDGKEEVEVLGLEHQAGAHPRLSKGYGIITIITTIITMIIIIIIIIIMLVIWDPLFDPENPIPLN